MKCPDPKCRAGGELQVNLGDKRKYDHGDYRRWLCRGCGRVYKTLEDFDSWCESDNKTLELFGAKRAAGES